MEPRSPLDFTTTGKFNAAMKVSTSRLPSLKILLMEILAYSCDQFFSLLFGCVFLFCKKNFPTLKLVPSGFLCRRQNWGYFRDLKIGYFEFDFRKSLHSLGFINNLYQFLDFMREIEMGGPIPFGKNELYSRTNEYHPTTYEIVPIILRFAKLSVGDDT